MNWLSLRTPNVVSSLFVLHFLNLSCHVLHAIVGIDDVDAGIHLAELGIELEIGGIHHVCNQSELAEIAGIHHVVVLLCQFHALSLRFQFYIGLLILQVGSLHIIVELLCLNGMCLFSLSGLYGCLLDAFVALEERAEAVFHAYAHIPDVEVLFNRWQFEEDRSVEVVSGNESYLWQKIALGYLLFLFSDADGVVALLQEWRIQGACRLLVSLTLLAVGLVGDSSIGDNLNLLACLVHLASFFLQVSQVHS